MSEIIIYYCQLYNVKIISLFLRELRVDKLGGIDNLKKIYMDHNATTPLHPEVKKTITGALVLLEILFFPYHFN